VRARLLASYLLFACALLVILEVPLGILETSRQQQATLANLDRQATGMAALASEAFEQGSVTDLRATATAFAGQAGFGIAVIDGRGNPVVVAGPRGVLGVAATERTNLLASKSASSSGRVKNPGGGGDLLFYARPVVLGPGSVDPNAAGAGAGTAPAGVVVATITTTRLDGRIRGVDLDLLGVGLAVLATAVVIALVLSRSLSRPVVEITGAVERIASGDLSARAPGEHGPPELRTLAARVNSMAARLDRLLVAQRAFVADASHQLRTPLTALRLRLENLGARVAPVDQADVDACTSEVARLSRLVDGLLALARAEEAVAVRLVVDIDTVANDRHDAWAPLADERGVTLDVRVPATPTRVWAVPGHLEQVLDNLLDNAVEATPAGRQVHVVVSNGAGAVEIHVVDEGPGMAPDERRRAFDRFWRGGETEGGSGLGLAIVRQLVDACGGTVELRGAPGGGVDATVTLERASSPGRPPP
jgi:signal transduction histidine kinase